MVFPNRSRSSEPRRTYREALVRELGYEIVPMKGVEGAMAALPPATNVSVTCSPVKGIDATLDLCDELVAAGHRPVPHLAARMVESSDHFRRIVDRLERAELTSVFVVAGDSAEPLGPYFDAIELMGSLVETAPWIESVGFTGYPDGHPLIAAELLTEAMHRKQALLADAGVTGHVVTQMCLDPGRIRSWLEGERSQGLELPVHLGIPGVIDRTKLLTLGMKLGIGSSLSYLKKNRNALRRLLSPRGYQPDQLLLPLAGDLQPLGVTALHVFTFNQVETTADWQRSVLD